MNSKRQNNLLVAFPRSQHACKKQVVDFRTTHEKVLDGLRERAKKLGSAGDKLYLPKIDVTSLFPTQKVIFYLVYRLQD